ncbi:MAG: nuclear transport factor 2 family protein [Pseudomonadota bacterium]
MTDQEADGPGLRAYCAYLEALTPERLADLGDFVDESVYFKDPFNDCHGLTAMKRVLEHMYKTLDGVRFSVQSIVPGDPDSFIAWRFESAWRGRPIEFDGASLLSFTPQGLVSRHIDYWDAASNLYEKMPIIGAPLAFLRRRAAVN